jgi:hypothetical protein
MSAGKYVFIGGAIKTFQTKRAINKKNERKQFLASGGTEEQLAIEEARLAFEKKELIKKIVFGLYAAPIVAFVIFTTFTALTSFIGLAMSGGLTSAFFLVFIAALQVVVSYFALLLPYRKFNIAQNVTKRAAVASESEQGDDEFTSPTVSTTSVLREDKVATTLKSTKFRKVAIIVITLALFIGVIASFVGSRGDTDSPVASPVSTTAPSDSTTTVTTPPVEVAPTEEPAVIDPAYFDRMRSEFPALMNDNGVPMTNEQILRAITPACGYIVRENDVEHAIKNVSDSSRFADAPTMGEATAIVALSNEFACASFNAEGI